MYRAERVGSKIVNRRWEKSQHEAHKDRLDTIKPTMHIKPVKEFRYLETRPKKKQLMEGNNFLFE